MAGEKIQRVPRGLSELLSTFGGVTPNQIGDTIQGMLELIQCYGLTQLQTRSSTDAAAVEGSGTGVTLSATNWTVLFGADMGVTKTATMTALGLGLLIRRAQPSFITLASEEFQRFGATETGLAVVAHRCPYPLLCPPNTVVFGGINILGTDANCNLTVTAEFGVLG